jgi:hypothetical protein
MKKVGTVTDIKWQRRIKEAQVQYAVIATKIKTNNCRYNNKAPINKKRKSNHNKNGHCMLNPETIYK